MTEKRRHTQERPYRVGRPIMIEVRLRRRWWLPYYLRGVALTAWLTGMEPNMQRVCYWAKKGIYAEYVVHKEGH